MKLRPGVFLGSAEEINLANGFRISEGIDERPGDIIDVNRLQLTGAASADRATSKIRHEQKRRRSESRPSRDHLHEFTARAVDERRAEDGPIEAAVADVLFGGEFGLVIIGNRTGA